MFVPDDDDDDDVFHISSAGVCDLGGETGTLQG